MRDNHYFLWFTLFGFPDRNAPLSLDMVWAKKLLRLLLISDSSDKYEMEATVFVSVDLMLTETNTFASVVTGGGVMCDSFLWSDVCDQVAPADEN